MVLGVSPQAHFRPDRLVRASLALTTLQEKHRRCAHGAFGRTTSAPKTKTTKKKKKAAPDDVSSQRAGSVPEPAQSQRPAVRRRGRNAVDPSAMQEQLAVVEMERIASETDPAGSAYDCASSDSADQSSDSAESDDDNDARANPPAPETILVVEPAAAISHAARSKPARAKA